MNDRYWIGILFLTSVVPGGAFGAYLLVAIFGCLFEFIPEASACRAY